MAQDVKSLLRVIESASQGQVEAYASLVLSLEKRFIFFFGFMRLENDNQLFNGFRCPDDSGKVFHYHSLSNAVWNDEPANPFISGNMPGKEAQKIEVGLKPISGPQIISRGVLSSLPVYGQHTRSPLSDRSKRWQG
jgi:hypothetical protein